MKKFTIEEVEKIREKINGGKIFLGVDKNGNASKYDYIKLSATGFIEYSHYGQSAIKNTTEKLAWLLSYIFEDFNDITEGNADNYYRYGVRFYPTQGAQRHDA